MNYISALAIVLGIVSGVISLYEFLKKRSRPGVAYSIAAVILLVAAGIVSNLPAPSGSQASGVSSAQSSPTSSSETGDTSSSTQGSPTQPPSQNPSPTAPPPGTLLYQADSSWSGWSGTKEWNVLNGMLINDGTGYPGQPTILAPDVLPVSDYVVEANIQVVNWPRCCYSQFAIVVRASNTSDGGWQGYSVGEDLNDTSADISAHAGDFGSSLGNAPFDPGASWHTYRIEVKGDTIKLLIDGGIKLAITDNSYLSGAQVGLWSYEVQLNISSFKITAL